MPIESANYIKDLNPTYPSAPDPVADSDNHLRLIKQAIKNTLPNLDAAVTAKPHNLMAFVPIGGIIMWSGSITDIPSGWALCDGTTNIVRSDGAGTINAPNLSDKFIKASKTDGSDHLASGGSNSKTATVGAAGGHTHSGSTSAAGAHHHGTITGYTALSIDQLPPHQHTVDAAFKAGGTGTGTYYPSTEQVIQGTLGTSVVGSGNPHTHSIAVDGNHAHTLAVNAVADHTHTTTIEDVRPAYFTLAFIMKI